MFDAILTWKRIRYAALLLVVAWIAHQLRSGLVDDNLYAGQRPRDERREYYISGVTHLLADATTIFERANLRNRTFWNKALAKWRPFVVAEVIPEERYYPTDGTITYVGKELEADLKWVDESVEPLFLLVQKMRAGEKIPDGFKYAFEDLRYLEERIRGLWVACGTTRIRHMFNCLYLFCFH